MSELVNKKANQGSQNLNSFKMPEAQPEKTIDLNLGLKNAEYRDKEQKISPERQQSKNDFAFPTEGISEELLKKLDLKTSKESREREAKAEKEIDELRARAQQALVKPVINTNQIQGLKSQTIKETVTAPPPHEDLRVIKTDLHMKKDIEHNRSVENTNSARPTEKVDTKQVTREPTNPELLVKNVTSRKVEESIRTEISKAETPVREAIASQKITIKPTQATEVQTRSVDEQPAKEDLKDNLTTSPNIQPERVAKIIAKSEVHDAPVQAIKIEPTEIQTKHSYMPEDNLNTTINKATTKQVEIESIQPETAKQSQNEEIYRPATSQERHIDIKLTAEVSLPQVERKPIPEPQLQTDRIEEKSAPVLSADAFMKPSVTRLEEQDLELLKDLAVKRNSQVLGNNLEISSEKETEKSATRKQVLDQEFIRLKPHGYVDTILDKLVSLLAGLLKKLEALFFGKSNKAKDIKSLKALRAAELEQFMIEKEKESRAQKIAKSSRARKNFILEDEKDIS